MGKAALEQEFLIGLGATKSGTSWLYRQLEHHPGFHTKSIKELHYFDLSRKTGSNFERSLLGRKAQLESLESIGNSFPVRQRISEIDSYLRVYRNPKMDFEKYSEFLGTGSTGRQILVDITPSYCEISAERLQDITANLGSVRFVYLMRDPVERAWSHIRMKARRNSEGDDEFYRNCRRLVFGVLSGQQQDVVSRGNYSELVQKLEASGLLSRSLVWAVDHDLGVDFLREFARFFGVDFNFSSAKIARRVHVGAKLHMRRKWRLELENSLKGQIEFYNSYLHEQRQRSVL